MADLTTTRSGGDLNYDLSQELHLDKYAQHILENGKSVAASTPTITTLSGSDFLHKLSASIFNSIQLSQTSLKQQAERHHQQQQQFQFSSGNGEYTSSIFTPTTTIATIASSTAKMDFDLVPNHIVIDSTNFGNIDDLQKQLEYDKFMNDVWIGIVMTLILISLVFCICSCFLYHQFRTWKQNYNATVAQSQTYDIESMKLNPASPDDPVPEYTLVSGLPTYEAALELLQKTPNSCVIVYPSVFSIFNKNEKSANKLTTDMAIQQQQQEQQQQQQTLTAIEVTTPLMASELANAKSNNNNNKYNKQQVPSYAEAIAVTNVTLTAVSEKSPTKQKYTCIDATTTTTTAVNATTTIATIPKLQKVPSYEEALLVKNDKQ